MDRLRIDLPLLLPDVPDARDACVARLQALLAPRKGIVQTHIREHDGTSEFCLHYDPALISGEEVRQLAHAVGAEVHARVGHHVLALRAVAGEDAGRRIEHTLGAIDGVLAVSVNLPAQRARVEFDRERVSIAQLEEAVRELGFAIEVPPPVVPPVPLVSWYQRNRELAWSLAAGAMLTAAFTAERATGIRTLWMLAVYAGSYVLGAYDLVRHSVASMRRGRFVFDIDLLMLFAAVGAAILGEWAEGAFLLFLFSLAHSLEHYALGRARVNQVSGRSGASDGPRPAGH